MSDTPDNLPPPPSYEAATQGQPPPDVGQKYPPIPTQTPYPQQQYVPPNQYPPQQPYPGNPPPGQYPQNPNMPAPGVVGYGPGYPMNTPGYNYNTYSGSVAPNGTPVTTYTGAGFVLTPDQVQQRKRKQLIMFFVIGIIMIVVFVIIVSSQMG